jgi:alpha-L-fucosidase
MIDHTSQPADSSRRISWYLDAKLGMFIHWGAYSVAGVEASWPLMTPDLAVSIFGNPRRISETEYRSLPSRFNPNDFDPKAWVQAARQAGMRYIIFTTKHHDGFCMFDAPDTDYKITKTPYKKDICLELAEACAAAGMRLGFYYSPPDMNHPGYRDVHKPVVSNWLGEPKRKEWTGYLDYMEGHLRKLLTDYGDISVIWFDALVNHAKYDPPRFHHLIHELSPATLINDRMGDDYDFITPEQFIPKKGIPIRTGKPPATNTEGEGLFQIAPALMKIPGIKGWMHTQLQKYARGELELTQVLQDVYPDQRNFQPWETCMTMGQSWAYNPTETDWKSSQKLIQNLVRIVSRGGNLLLNVGPTPQGTFPPEALERLNTIGDWVQKNGDAVFATRYVPCYDLPFGSATRQDDKINLFIFDRPANGKIEIENINANVNQANLISGEPLRFTMHKNHLEIELPAQFPHSSASVVVAHCSSISSECSDSQQAKLISTKTYLRSQIIANAVINILINGIIAYFAYRSRISLPFLEIAVDILITVAIISFLVSWIAIPSVRKELAQGKIFPWQPAAGRFLPLKLPTKPVLGALLIMVLFVLIFGGLLVGGSIYVFSSNGMVNWIYIVTKTTYTGICAALAVAVSIIIVLKEKNPVPTVK